MGTRRKFLKNTAIASTALGIAPQMAGKTFATHSGLPATDPFSGIQIAAHSFYDEGMDYCLDLLQGKAALNNLMVSFHAYYGAIGRPKQVMGDHGVPKPDNSKRTLRRCWVDHNEKFYADTPLRHKGVKKDEFFADKNIMNDLLEGAHKRGMTVYERLYEPHGESVNEVVENYDSVFEINFEGNRTGNPCLNHPHYQNFILGTVRDLFSNYDLDGIQFGAERSGPMGGLLHWNGKPACFCEHCQKRMKENNIDPERLRTGFAELHQYMNELQKSDAAPSDGAWTVYLRHMMQYPETLTWEWQWHRAQNELHKMVYDSIKKIKPEAQVGRHVSCVETAMDMFYRAGAPFEEMTPNNDFIKIITYHEITGPRLLWWHLTPLGKTIYKELSHEQILDLFYTQNHHNKSKNPSLKDLEKAGLSPDFVRSETKRAVVGAKGKAAIYSGVGMDIPVGSSFWGNKPWYSNPKGVYEAVVGAFEAGAKGVVASREYEEMTLSSLKAFGDGVREFS
jgi:hypothetical protein